MYQSPSHAQEATYDTIYQSAAFTARNSAARNAGAAIKKPLRRQINFLQPKDLWPKVPLAPGIYVARARG